MFERNSAINVFKFRFIFFILYRQKKYKGSKQLFTHSLLDLVNGSFVFMYVEEKKKHTK